MKGRNLVVLIVILVVGGLLYFYFKGEGREETSWRTAKVNRGDIVIEVTATGTINADTTVNVGTQVSGTIAKLYADFNSEVRRGQIIALLDTTFLAAAVEDAQAIVQKAQIAVDQSKRDFDRAEQLYNDKFSSQTDYEQARLIYETNKNILRSANAQLKRAEINLRYATIRSPINGVVISRQVDVGQTVAASYNTPTLFVIANNLRKMQVLATIDETDIGQVKVGQLANFTVDAYPSDNFSGKISQIRLQPVTIQNVVNYIVVINASNPDLKLMPGMTANISIKIKEHSDVLKVPVSALKFSPSFNTPSDSASNEKTQLKDAGKIWLMEGDTIVMRPVTTGLSDGAYIEVNGEIKEGDWVITGNNTEAKSNTNKNPFIPQMRSRPSSNVKK